MNEKFCLKNCKQRQNLYLLSATFTKTEEQDSYRTEHPCESFSDFYPDTGYKQTGRAANDSRVLARLPRSILDGGLNEVCQYYR